MSTNYTVNNGITNDVKFEKLSLLHGPMQECSTTINECELPLCLLQYLLEQCIIVCSVAHFD